MSVTSKLPLVGLARDPGAITAGESNALRRAENVVLRSEGVIETRPSFGLLYENRATPNRVRALREFRGVPLAVVQAGTSHLPWSIVNLLTGSSVPEVDVAPVDPASETRFAESRRNLYLTSAAGILALEDPTFGPRLTGVEMQLLTDLAVDGANGAVKTSCAYRIVFVRKDSNDYVRRSAPSARIILTSTGAPQAFGVAQHVYFPTGMLAGDQIELYRSLSLAGISPRPEHYLAVTYTLTAADVARGYAGPITDATADADLGAQLYTDAAESGALAAKFQPPIAQNLAWWQRVMWYGHARQRHRLLLALENLYFAGVASFSSSAASWDISTAFAAGVANVAHTAGLYVGMTVTDNLLEGPSFGPGPNIFTHIPANSRITNIVTDTSVTISNPFTFVTSPEADTIEVAALPLRPANGLMAGRLKCESTINTPFLSMRSDAWHWLRPGMWAAGPPDNPLVDNYLPARTRIVAVDPLSGNITLDHNALVTDHTPAGVDFSFGDVITVNGVDFFCYPDTQVSADPQPPLLPIGDPADSGEMGSFNRGRVIQNLARCINTQRFTGGAPYPGAQPVGDTWDRRDVEYATDGLRTDPGTLATSLDIEDTAQITVVCTCPTAFLNSTVVQRTIADPFGNVATYDVGQLTSDNPDVPHRVYFSDLDEPESVPLLNYFDVGAAGEAVLALVPLRNALLVFKTDGLWRITGSGPAAWSVEPLDPTIHLVRAEAVTVLRNVAYAWCVGGFYAITENGAQSISQNKLDVELREILAGVDARTSGFVVGSLQRNLVVFGVPLSPVQDKRPRTLRAYAYHTVTGQWSEWPVSWTHAAESAVADTLYVSRPEGFADGAGPVGSVNVEVRAMSATYDGIDRTYALGPSLSVSGTAATVLVSDAGTWSPVVGDWLSATDGATRFYRRLTAVAETHSPDTWHLTLEAEITALGGLLITDTGDFFVTDTGFHIRIADLSGWEGHESIPLTLEWHPTSPAGIPIGTLARELQMQLDLRDAPDPAVIETLPQYDVGGTSDRNAFATVRSAMARIPQIQPLRVGVSRQVARTASLAPYFATSDVFAMRLVGASVVFEGTSERTRR